LSEDIDESEERMIRYSNPDVDSIIGKKYPVLEKGFVALVDYMGGDGAIVQAARVSYGKGTKTVSDDTGLIRYLMRHRHTTPFEMVELKIPGKHADLCCKAVGKA
jgi:thymidylate synthase (FAD)